MITTKRGTNKAPTISFSANYTYKSPTTSMELADYVTSMRAYNQAMANDGSWNKLIPGLHLMHGNVLMPKEIMVRTMMYSLM